MAVAGHEPKAAAATPMPTTVCAANTIEAMMSLACAATVVPRATRIASRHCVTSSRVAGEAARRERVVEEDACSATASLATAGG
jgi:hypothetical protein